MTAYEITSKVIQTQIIFGSLLWNTEKEWNEGNSNKSAVCVYLPRRNLLTMRACRQPPSGRLVTRDISLWILRNAHKFRRQLLTPLLSNTTYTFLSRLNYAFYSNKRAHSQTILILKCLFYLISLRQEACKVLFFMVYNLYCSISKICTSVVDSISWYYSFLYKSLEESLDIRICAYIAQGCTAPGAKETFKMLLRLLYMR